ncbi:hypothetical protein NDU88_001466 [Pleurodeles waltl]|uniref:Uncharacterized protein n=1 Tax=Pleurodeles waltl TaxID=8319 RepID=A0AAV7WM19_PLEWA|nr:hypothetical protein NDU88_001466 [Pleurodeles waltl]
MVRDKPSVMTSQTKIDKFAKQASQLDEAGATRGAVPQPDSTLFFDAREQRGTGLRSSPIFKAGVPLAWEARRKPNGSGRRVEGRGKKQEPPPCGGWRMATKKCLHQRDRKARSLGPEDGLER